MRKSILVVAGIVGITVGVAACGGDGGSENETCSTLKIAGGAECPVPPKAIVVVRNGRGYCSGTFITKQHVLTAAHCFPSGAAGVTIQSQYFSFTAAKVQKHPSFNPSAVSDPNDVAIVTIGQEVAVDPVPINLSSNVSKGDSVVTYGFGLDESDETFIGRVDNGEAALKATTLDIIGVSDRSIESISDGSGDTCQGDSGGSLLLTGNNSQPGVVAIVRAGPLPCQPEGGPSDNTNLQAASVLNFVKKAAPGVTFN